MSANLNMILLMVYEGYLKILHIPKKKNDWYSITLSSFVLIFNFTL